MPDYCNGLHLIDPNKPFHKLNCEWGTRSSGRPAKVVRKPNKPNPKGKFKNPKAVCFTLEKDHVDFIKDQAAHKSVETGQTIEPAQLIREALQKAFPAPKQFDMFGEKHVRK